MPKTSAAVAPPRPTVDYEMVDDHLMLSCEGCGQEKVVDGPLSAWAAANWLRHFEEQHVGCAPNALFSPAKAAGRG